MRNRRTILVVLVLATLIFLATAIVLGAGFHMKWSNLGSGGSYMEGSNTGLASAIGQPVSGRFSNGYTLTNGVVLPAQGESRLMIPVILDGVS